MKQLRNSGALRAAVRPLIVVVMALTGFTLIQSNLGVFGSSKQVRAHKSYKAGCKHIRGKRFKKAHKQLKTAADNGHGKAQTLLGMLYEKGVGVEKDTEKAIVYYERAAIQGIPEAESRLGHLLWDLEKESEVVSLETASWLKKAARHGEVEAQVTLGKMALDVKNSPIAQNEAVWYLKDAAKKGNDQARGLLSRMPKPPSSVLGNPAQQVSAGVQGLTKSWKGYSDLANTINQASTYRK